MHHPRLLFQTFAGPEQGFGGKDCQNASQETLNLIIGNIMSIRITYPLTFHMPGKDFSRRHFETLPQKNRLTFHAIYMKCQSLLFWQNKKDVKLVVC